MLECERGAVSLQCSKPEVEVIQQHVLCICSTAGEADTPSTAAAATADAAPAKDAPQLSPFHAVVAARRAASGDAGAAAGADCRQQPAGAAAIRRLSREDRCPLMQCGDVTNRGQGRWTCHKLVHVRPYRRMVADLCTRNPATGV